MWPAPSPVNIVFVLSGFLCVLSTSSAEDPVGGRGGRRKAHRKTGTHLFKRFSDPPNQKQKTETTDGSEAFSPPPPRRKPCYLRHLRSVSRMLCRNTRRTPFLFLVLASAKARNNICVSVILRLLSSRLGRRQKHQIADSTMIDGCLN